MEACEASESGKGDTETVAEPELLNFAAPVILTLLELIGIPV